MHVLIVEDDAAMTDALRAGLEGLSYTTTAALSAPAAFDALDRTRFDLVLLDLELPGGDGLDILRCLRGRPATAALPVIIMTGGRTSSVDAVTGLDSGADDYLKKPFEFAELIARIRAVLRRSQGGGALCFKIADLDIDLASRHVARDGRVIELTQREFSLLEFLARHEDRIVTRQAIAESVWKDQAHAVTMENIINVHLSHLRRKVDGEGQRKLIHTIRGHGICLSARPELH